jgi:hypothetical protein
MIRQRIVPMVRTAYPLVFTRGSADIAGAGY